MTSRLKNLFGSKRPRAGAASGPAATAGSHERAHEIVAHLEVLIATSSQMQIPAYLHGERAADIAMAVGICDSLLAQASPASPSIADAVMAETRQALVAALKLRGESQLLTS